MLTLEERCEHTNISNYIYSPDEDERDMLHYFISSFSCFPNPDIEHFLKHNAIEFTKKHQSVTYLVFTREKPHMLVGYFALSIKPFVVGVQDIPSNTWRRKIERVARFDESTQTYSATGYLIAQLGKNYTNGANERITGVELMDIALDIVYDLQDMAGGMIAFLDAENNDSLINFYTQNGFHLISDPKSPREELIQFYRMI